MDTKVKDQREEQGIKGPGGGDRRVNAIALRLPTFVASTSSPPTVSVFSQATICSRTSHSGSPGSAR